MRAAHYTNVANVRYLKTPKAAEILQSGHELLTDRKTDRLSDIRTGRHPGQKQYKVNKDMGNRVMAEVLPCN